MSEWIIEKGTKHYQSLVDSTAPINIWHGSVRSGKTVSANVRWLAYIANAPPGALIMVGKTLDTLKRNILQDLSEKTREAFTFSLGQREARFLGRKIHLVGANDDRSEAKIRGMTLAGGYGDEITLWPSSFWDMLHTRFSVAGAKFFGTTNPDTPLHWLKTNVIDNEEMQTAGDVKSFHFGLDDNPHLPVEYKEKIRRQYTGVWYKRFILGQWVIAEGIIYDMFTDSMVCACPFSPVDYYVGVDYGTQNATVFLLLATDYKSWHVVREYYYSGREQQVTKSPSEYVADMLDFIGGQQVSGVFIDPSAQYFVNELNKTGLPVRLAQNAVIDGIRHVSNMFFNGRLTISPACQNLRKELESYAWDEGAILRGEEKPLKINDHAADALRYVSYTMRHDVG